MTAILLVVTELTVAGGAGAQTPVLPASAPASSAPPPPASPPAPAPAPASAAGPAEVPPPAATGAVAPSAAGATAPASGALSSSPPPAAGAPAPGPATPWWSGISGDAFVDTYGAINWNFPRPQFGETYLHAYDDAQGFSVNWLGLDASYSADPIGGTISLRFGPGAFIHNGPVTLGTPVSQADDAIGMEFVRQAYATVKVGALTLDMGKYDQPFGSEVPDSQLNMEYTRSLLYTLNQPLFFTGVRLDYALASAVDLKLIASNGWNNTFDDNRGKTVGGQLSLKPIDQFQFYVGYAGGPEQPDYGTDASGANANWRHLVDFVADFNPTSALRFLLNADYDTQILPTRATDHTAAVWYGANLAIKYVVADPFTVVLRGEIFGDKHGDIVPNAEASAGASKSSTVESGTLTLSYVVASHYTIMLDNRVDAADSASFPTEHSTAKAQFTTTLGVIASTH
ncbi:MAG: outer membrane beta-barrel protein [Polyangiaceae bacterium]